MHIVRRTLAGLWCIVTSDRSDISIPPAANLNVYLVPAVPLCIENIVLWHIDSTPLLAHVAPKSIHDWRFVK